MKAILLLALPLKTGFGFATVAPVPMSSLRLRNLPSNARENTSSVLFATVSTDLRLQHISRIDDMWRIRSVGEFSGMFGHTVVPNSRARRLAALFLVLGLLPLLSRISVTEGGFGRGLTFSAGIATPWRLLLAALFLHGTNLLAKAGAWYMSLLSIYPVLTKSITAGVIGFAGDCLAQGIEHKLYQQKKETASGSFRLDILRGISILTDGIFISGPLMHLCYEMFEQVLPSTSSSLAALSHVVADSVILDSIFVATTFLVTGIVEGYKPRQILPQMRRDYLPALKASWMTSLLVFPIEFVCFRCLPLTFRVLAVNFIDVIWDAVVSFMAHRSRHRGPSGDVAPALDPTVPSLATFSA